MKNMLRVLLTSMVVSGVLLVAPPREAAAHRHRVYVGYCPAPVYYHAWNPRRVVYGAYYAPYYAYPAPAYGYPPPYYWYGY